MERLLPYYAAVKSDIGGNDMNKIKKFLSGILIMALVLISCASTVLASEQSNKASSGFTQLPFTKIFESEDKQTTLPKSEFTFTLKPYKVTQEGGANKIYGTVNEYTGIELTKDTVTIKFPESTKTSETISSYFDVSGLADKFKEKMGSDKYALFRYTMYEVGGNDINIEYSDAVYYIDFLVNSSYDITAFVLEDNGASSKPENFVFTNKYKKPVQTENDSDSLTIKKVVTGDTNNTKEFEFKLSIFTENSNLTIGQQFEATIAGKTADKVTVGTDYTFKLKNGEELVVNGVPEGMEYKVEETKNTGYYTTITYSSDVNNGKQENEKDKIIVGTSCEASIVHGKNSVLFTNIKETTSNVTNGFTFVKIFESELGGATPIENFVFKMVPDSNASGTLDNIPIVPGISLEDNGTVSLEFQSAEYGEQTGTFSFNNIQFEGTQIYRYIVSEVKPSDSSVKYDGKNYTVDVKVVNGAITSVTSKEYGKTEEEPVVFVNTYKADELVIKKQVSGDLGDKSEKFKFELFIPGPGEGINITVGTQYPVYIYDSSTKTKTQKGYVTVGQNYAFELADGDMLYVENVPENMIYTVTEVGGKDYTTNITCTTSVINDGSGEYDKNVVTVNGQKIYDASNGNGHGTPIVVGENVIVFENIKDYNADTGVRLDVIPYIVVFIIAIAGVVVFLATRKKRENRF
jgi:pilin isopeptide linkage protein